MQIASRLITYNAHSRENPPQITVAAGEEFMAQTELCTGSWLHSLADTWSPEKTNALNPTVCVGVADAHPGDILAVHIREIIPDALGYTGFNDQKNPLAGRIKARTWGLNVKTVAITAEGIRWNDQLSLPVRPMIGTLGTAPAGEARSNAWGGLHGGNMDVQEIRAGTTVYLPVFVEGALLHIGDVHALQGDGEINCSGGIECRAEVRLSADLIRQARPLRCVRAEDSESLMTIACGRGLTRTFQTATGELLDWICRDYGIPVNDAYLLLGQVMQARCTQFVNPTRSYICKIPKRYLPLRSSPQPMTP